MLVIRTEQLEAFRCIILDRFEDAVGYAARRGGGSYQDIDDMISDIDIGNIKY